ncbi:MAG: Stp1/IreP family PP2C-type Ser/Thr phosphatase [Deltaproteobacteria bacterium]|nr:MAG: Stp1/IreP family PP2C-type Ser/Thr phosphatase [Deltaproteobacteria bacterium]
MIRIESCGRTDVGMRRSNNEDTFVSSPELGLLALADGMGGAASGEVASGIFADTVLELLSNGSPPTGEEAEDLVRKTFLLANQRIRELAARERSHKDMGCTGEVVVFTADGYVLGHVGDSRIYLFREDRLRQVTKDHSFVQEQVDQGMLTLEQARVHAYRHMILRAVGIHDSVAVDLISGKAYPGDLFLLCSDGLTDMVEDSLIEETLASDLSLEARADRLVRTACDAGGHDNVTVVLGLVLQTG